MLLFLVHVVVTCSNFVFLLFIQQCPKYFTKQQSYSNNLVSFVDKTGVITANVTDHPDWTVDIPDDHCQVRIDFYD